MSNLELKVEKYIKKRERFSGRILTPHIKFLLRDFAKYIQYDVSDAFDQPQPLPESAGGNRVAFIIQNVGHMTGGRYYAWFVACALQEIGYDVTIYSNLKPAFYDNFRYYKVPKLQIITNDAKELAEKDIKADLYIGAPIYGALAASELGKKYEKPSYAMVFDPWPMLDKYVTSSDKFFWSSGWDDLLQSLLQNDTKIITLCKATTPYVYEWLNKKPEDVFDIVPCINSRELDAVKMPARREDYVVFISRLAKHKNIEHVLNAAAKNKVPLKIISSTQDNTTHRLAREVGCKVEFLTQISDKEKFETISRARAVINGSTFEGWGLWASEAIATGTPLVCYDYPTIREQQELSGVDNMYFAKWNDPEDLSRKLGEALKERKFREPNASFTFDKMVERVKEVLPIEPKIGVVMIALNEEQCINASLRAVNRHKNIAKIAVVEGAVTLFSHAATEAGQSIDKTVDEVQKVMRTTNKIVFDRYGWAKDKSELRNRALELLGTEITHVLVVDADEIWSQEDLDRLTAAMKENPNTGVFEFRFNHFFKNLKQIAVGGQWDSMLFRCFKYADKSLRWKQHQLPPVNLRNEYIRDTHGSMVVEGIRLCHLGYVKDKKRVQEKLEYYRKRDKHLNVVDNFTDWKPGKPTSSTHHNGGIQKYEGDYPPEVKGIL